MEFESPHPAAASPASSCPRGGRSPEDGPHRPGELGAVAARGARHPGAHPTLVLSANPKSLPPAGLHEPDVTLTFHIALLRFEYAEERKAPGLHWSAELRRALGPWPPSGSTLAGRSSAYRLIRGY